MKNTIRQTVTGIIYQGQRALPRVQTNLAALGYSVAQGTAFATRITDAIATRDGFSSAKMVYGASRTENTSLVKPTRLLVMAARDALKPRLGREHSEAWVEAGFDTSLAVAVNAAGLLRQVQGLKAYLTAHTEHENAAIDITAVRFDGLAADLIARIAALDLAKSTLITAASDRDAKARLVREELRMLLAKLKVMFDPFAAMWETVGFNRRGFVSVPSIPSKLSAVLIGTSAALKWDPAQRAERYRVWKKVVGVDEDFVLIETREALDYVLEGLPAGRMIEIAISAVNRGGESAKSEVVTVVTP